MDLISRFNESQHEEVPSLKPKERLAHHRENHLSKLRQERTLRREEEEKGPQGEALSTWLLKTEHIEIDKIKSDPTFLNLRLASDIPSGEEGSGVQGQSIEDLMSSMNWKGLIQPIAVMPGPDCYFVRAGFRRVHCARKLGWKKIPAGILDPSTPLIEEYWYNIVENSARKSLSTYERAHAAKVMRDKFGISPKEFSKRTGYSESYAYNLLYCIDRLPDEIVDQWKAGARVAFSQLCELASYDHMTAIRFFYKMTGQRPKKNTLGDMIDEEVSGPKGGPRKLPPSWMLDRMKRLYVGIEGGNLEPKVRSLCLMIIEFCETSRSTIPGVYEPHQAREYERKRERRLELGLSDMPNPDDGESANPLMLEIE